MPHRRPAGRRAQPRGWPAASVGAMRLQRALQWRGRDRYRSETCSSCKTKPSASRARARGAQPAAELAQALSEALRAADHARCARPRRGSRGSRPCRSDRAAGAGAARAADRGAGLGLSPRGALRARRHGARPAAAGAAQGPAGQGRRRARDRRCGLSAGKPRACGPAGDPGAHPDRRARRARAQPRVPAGDRRPSHADGFRGGAAVLDGRAGHRPHARGRGAARDLLRHLRGRPHLPRAGQRRPEPPPAHQARGRHRHHHGRRPATSCWRPPTRRRWRASSSATI